MTYIPRADYDRLYQIVKSKKAKRAAKRKTIFSGKPKPPSKSEWHKKLWTIVSLWVRAGQIKATGKCRQCEEGIVQNACHVLPRTHWTIRYLPANLYGGCRGCNFGENMNRSLYRDKHKIMVGEKVFSDLESWGRIPAEFDVTDLIEMYDEFKTRYEQGNFNDFVPGPIARRLEDRK